MTATPFLSAVLPCFNEIEGLPSIERDLFPELERLRLPFEVVFVDDGSTDGTAAALRALALKRPGILVLEHGANRGLGAAIRTGIGAATGEWIAVLDSDLTFHPRHLKDLLDAQKSTGADCVSGTPYPPKGRMAARPGRALPSRIVNGFYRLALGLRHGAAAARLTAWTPIFRLYRASTLKAIPLQSEGFEINTEILAALLARGHKVEEAGVILTKREHGVSKIRPLRELAHHAVLALRLLAGR